MNEPDNQPMKYFLTQQATDKPSANIFEIDSYGVIRIQAGAMLDYESTTGTTTSLIAVS